MEALPKRISKRKGSYVLGRYINGKRLHFYSTDLSELIEYDKMLDNGIIPKKERFKGLEYSEDELNKILYSENERWKWLKGYEGFYAISDKGSVVSFWKNRNGKRMKIKNKNGWYLSFRACNSIGEFKTIRIHIALANAFIGEIPKGYHVHHKDGNRQNNSIENLAILSTKEHCAETLKQNPHILDGMIAYNKGRYTGKYKLYKRNRNTNNHKFQKGKILQYTLNGELVGKYYNSMDAYRETGVCQRNILQVANKEPFNSKGSVRKQAGGFVWKFESEVMK